MIIQVVAKQVIALLNSDFRLDTPDQSKSVLMASRSRVFFVFQLTHLKIFQNSASPIHKYPKPGFQISVTRSEIGNPGFGFQSKTRNSDFRDLINLYPSFCFFLAKVEFYIRLTLCKEIFFLIMIFKNYIKLIDGSQYDNNKIFKL